MNQQLAVQLEQALAEDFLVLDIGGEGRHEQAWNVNPSPVKTFGEERGRPIPRHVPGRAEAIPFPDSSVDHLIVERTPLRVAALHELVRVVKPQGRITLRHVHFPASDPHAQASQIIPGTGQRTILQMGKRIIQQMCFQVAKPAG